MPWLTQARPVTTLFPLPAARPDGRAARLLLLQPCPGTAPAAHARWASRSSGDRNVGRAHVRPPAGRPLAGPPGVHEAAGRVFFDITTLMQHPVGRAVFPQVLDVMEARSAAVLRNSPTIRGCRSSSSRWPFLRPVARSPCASGSRLSSREAVARPAATRRRLAAWTQDLGAGHAARRPTSPERLDFVMHILGDTVIPMVPAGHAGRGCRVRDAGSRRQAARRPTPGRATCRACCAALPHNVTTEMDLELWQLATLIRPTRRRRRGSGSDHASADSAAIHGPARCHRASQRELSAFLDRYGHRAVAEIDIGLPRWSEDPTHILGVLANYLRLDDPDRAPDAVFASGAAEAEAMVATLTARARQRGRLRGRIVGFALDRARQLAGLRELPKYDIVLVLARAAARACARRRGTGRAGADRRADDVFFLTWARPDAARRSTTCGTWSRQRRADLRPRDASQARAARAAQRRDRARSATPTPRKQ